MAQVNISDEVFEAVKKVRSDPDVDHVVIGYEGKKDLKVLGFGLGGFDAICALLPEDDFAYGIYRTTLLIDNSKTTKFSLVQWQPDAAPPMKKALLGTQSGHICETLFQPYHVDLKASDKGDLNEDEIKRKLEEAAGVRVHVLTNQEAADRGGPAQMTGNVARTPRKNTAGQTKQWLTQDTQSATTLEIDNAEELKEAIANVRNDQHENDWALAGYVSKKKIGLKGQGTGGVAALVNSFDDKGANYGIFRTTELIDKSMTVKFVFVDWQPDSISLFEKASLATHKGVVEEAFAPFHTQFRITSRDELNEQVVKDRLSELSGKGDRAEAKIGVAVAEKKQVETKKKNLGGATAEGAAVGVLDRELVQEAIAGVRSDTSEDDWVLVGYDSQKAANLVLVASGSGSVDAMMDKVQDGSVNYGLFRVVDQIDKSTTTKFVFVHWQSEDTPTMMKGRVSTHKGAVQELFGQWHVDFFISSKDEISLELACRRVGEVSNSLSMVKQSAE